MSEIQDTFNNIAKNYDSQRRKLIPCFDDLYRTSVSVIEAVSEWPEVLDIGAGTGLMSAFLLKKYPKARLTLIDISEKMLDIARIRFKDHSGVRYIAGDYAEHIFTDRFDIIISGLSIHHLGDRQKEQLYRKCFEILKPKGIFVNAEQVLGSTPYLDNFYRKEWKLSIEESGISEEEMAAGYERMKLDKEATVEQQLYWLRQAGFTDVDCIYKYFNFAVLFGRKH